MEQSPTAHRPAQRREPRKAGAGRTKAVAVEEVAYHQVEAQSKKLQMSKSKYASAAIGYFASTGLDPTQEQPKGLASVASKVGEETMAVHKQNHEIGTRLIQIIRVWERNLYTFMQQQQATTYNYLELIESNILQHQVSVETSLLAPLVEHLLKTNLEANTGRNLAARLLMEVTQKPDFAKTPAQRYQDQKVQLDDERDLLLTNLMREFLKTNSVPLPKPTARRAVTPVPAKPVAPASPAPAVPPKS